MKKTQFVLFLLVLTAAGNVRGQNTWQEEVNRINGMTLEANYDVWPESYIALYSDEQGCIRKYVRWVEYPESRAVEIAYYTGEGQLVRLIFNSQQPEGASYWGTARMERDRHGNESLFYDYVLRESYGADSLESRTTARQAVPRQPFGELSIYSALLPFHTPVGLADDYAAADFASKKVTFVAPVAGDRTLVNANEVLLRQGPSVEAAIVRALNAGDRVRIVEVLDAGWYRVEIPYLSLSGCVFGEFLEPVEK